jgi:hypothetical protein
MKKLRLDLETLSVESFDATPREGRVRGTVRARSAFTEEGCPTEQCTAPELGSCASSCNMFQACGCAAITAGASCLPHHC